MGITHAVVEGTLKPDGSLELAERFRLPPGRVRVTVEVLDAPDSKDKDWFEYLDDVRRRREALGTGPRAFRTREEIDAEIGAMRDEWDRP